MTAPSLVEFLLARRAEAVEQGIIADAAWDAVQMDLRGEKAVEWMRVYDKSLTAQARMFGVARDNVGWAILSVVWPSRVRREAAKYADHPNYRPEWRP